MALGWGAATAPRSITAPSFETQVDLLTGDDGGLSGDWEHMGPSHGAFFFGSELSPGE